MTLQALEAAINDSMATLADCLDEFPLSADFAQEAAGINAGVRPDVLNAAIATSTSTASFRPGDSVEYERTAYGSGIWLPATVLQVNLSSGTFDLDQERGVACDRIRVLPQIDSARGLSRLAKNNDNVQPWICPGVCVEDSLTPRR